MKSSSDEDELITSTNPELVTSTNPADTSLGVSNVSLFSRLSRQTSFIGAQKFAIIVQLLDEGKSIVDTFKKSCTGQDVLNFVCQRLNIVEKDYFGLQFCDANQYRYWVDLAKSLSKQFHQKNVLLRFRFRFYPVDPSCLKEPVTRYQLFAQIQRDILHARLVCPQSDAATLGGYILQANMGDFSEDEMDHGGDYVSGYTLFPRQSPQLEEKIADVHQSLIGLSAEEAESKCLELASRFDTYGFSPYTVQTAASQPLEVNIGANHLGVLVYMKNQKVHQIPWSQLEKVDYIGKQLVIVPSKEYMSNYVQNVSNGELDQRNASLFNTSFSDSATEEKENVKQKTKKLHLKLVCPSATFAKHLWRHILSQQVFFTEDQATSVKPKFSKPRIPLFSRGSSFRYTSNRVLHEIQQDTTLPRSADETKFVRSTLRKGEPRSVNESWKLTASSSFNSVNNQRLTVDGSAGQSGISVPNESSDAADTSLLDASAHANKNGFIHKAHLESSSEVGNNTSAASSSNESPFANGSLPNGTNGIVTSTPITKHPLSNGTGRFDAEEFGAHFEKTKRPTKTDPSRGVTFYIALLVFVVATTMVIVYALAIAYPQQFREMAAHIEELPYVYGRARK